MLFRGRCFRGEGAAFRGEARHGRSFPAQHLRPGRSAGFPAEGGQLPYGKGLVTTAEPKRLHRISHCYSVAPCSRMPCQPTASSHCQRLGQTFKVQSNQQTPIYCHEQTSCSSQKVYCIVCSMGGKQAAHTMHTIIASYCHASGPTRPGLLSHPAACVLLMPQGCAFVRQRVENREFKAKFAAKMLLCRCSQRSLNASDRITSDPWHCGAHCRAALSYS